MSRVIDACKRTYPYDLKLRLSTEEWQDFVSIAAIEYDIDAEAAAKRGQAHREDLGISSPHE